MSSDLPLISRLSIKFTAQCNGYVDSQSLVFKTTTDGIRWCADEDDEFNCYLTNTQSVRSWIDFTIQGKPWSKVEFEVHILPLTEMDESKDILFEKRIYSFTEICKLRELETDNEKEAFRAGNIDMDCEDSWTHSDMTAWTIGTYLSPIVSQMIDSVRTLRLVKELEGVECPVMMCPLTARTARQFGKCNHFIHVEALQKLCKGGNPICCPLCRAEHQRYEIK